MGTTIGLIKEDTRSFYNGSYVHSDWGVGII